MWSLSADFFFFFLSNKLNLTWIGENIVSRVVLLVMFCQVKMQFKDGTTGGKYSIMSWLSHLINISFCLCFLPSGLNVQPECGDQCAANTHLTIINTCSPRKKLSKYFLRQVWNLSPCWVPSYDFFSAVIKLSVWKKKNMCLWQFFSSGLTGVAFGSHCYTELISQWVVMLIFASKLSRVDFLTVKIIWTEKENICNLSIPALLNCPTGVAVLL